MSTEARLDGRGELGVCGGVCEVPGMFCGAAGELWARGTIFSTSAGGGCGDMGVG